MAELFYDKVWVREPRLMVPRMAPIGPARLSGLLPNKPIAYFLASEGTYKGTVTGTFTRVARSRGIAYSQASATKLSIPVTGTNADGITLVYHGRHTTDLYTGSMCGVLSGTSVISMVYLTSGGPRLPAFYPKSSASIALATINAPTEIVLVGSYTGTDYYIVGNVNGTLSEASSSTTGTGTFDSFQVGSFFGDSRNWEHYFAAGFIGAVPISVARQIAMDPYSLVAPA